MNYTLVIITMPQLPFKNRLSAPEFTCCISELHLIHNFILICKRSNSVFMYDHTFTYTVIFCLLFYIHSAESTTFPLQLLLYFIRHVELQSEGHKITIKTLYFPNLLFFSSSRIKSVFTIYKFYKVFKIPGDSPKTWLVCVCPADNQPMYLSANYCFHSVRWKGW